MSTIPLSDDTRDDELVLPPEPERPDCCNGGCAICVLDGWYEEMDAWRQECRAIKAAHAATQAAKSDALPKRSD
jgi:hypothetical protein